MTRSLAWPNTRLALGPEHPVWLISFFKMTLSYKCGPVVQVSCKMKGL